jgi:hypothetical protein
LMMMSKKKKRSTTISNQNVALPVNQRANALLPLRCAALSSLRLQLRYLHSSSSMPKQDLIGTVAVT